MPILKLFGLSAEDQPTTVENVSETISVSAVVTEKTFVGKVDFPATVPEGLIGFMRFPEDLYENVEKMGLNQRTVKFLLGALSGKWSLTANADLQNIAIKTAMQYSEMDAIIRDLIEKNYARLDKRIDLYRFWIVLLYVKGIRFVESGD
jgi:hypothetical protein